MEAQREELTILFDKYKQEIENLELKRILERNFVYSIVEPKADVLICGINPSFRINEDPNAYDSFNFNSLKVDKPKHTYFKKFFDLLESHPLLSATYLDIFYQRHTDQKEIAKFLKDEKGLEFLCQQLAISKKKIESLKPKLILVFNKQASSFFGIDQKNDTNVWLGYTFEPFLDIKGAYKITGLLSSNARINKEVTTTLLKGSIIYFSRYYDYRTKKEVRAKIDFDVKALLNSLG